MRFEPDFVQLKFEKMCRCSEKINFGRMTSKEFLPNIRRFLPPPYLSNERPKIVPLSVRYGWIRYYFCNYDSCLSLPQPQPQRQKPLPPSNNETKRNSGKKKARKTRIPKEALEILRDVAQAEIKPKEETVQDKSPEALKAEKKKPKTHFRKSQKPGRA